MVTSRISRLRMKTILIIIVFCCLITGMNTTGEETGATGQEDSKPRVRDEVLIMAHGIIMPLGKIILIGKDSQYCAVKFTEAWTGKTKEDRYAKYESHYQGDRTGDFSNKNVQLREEQLIDRRMVGISRFFSFPAGPRNQEVKCGPIRLRWTAKGSVYKKCLLNTTQLAGWMKTGSLKARKHDIRWA
jgi:hypothetical protein